MKTFLTSKRTLGWLIAAVVGVAVFAGTVWRFGSVRTLAAALNGTTLLIDFPPKNLGPLRTGAVHRLEVRCQNLTSKPVRLLGLTATCSCIAIPSFPEIVGPWETVVVPMFLTVKAGDPREHTLTLFTSDNGLSSFTSRIGYVPVREGVP